MFSRDLPATSSRVLPLQYNLHDGDDPKHEYSRATRCDSEEGEEPHYCGGEAERSCIAGWRCVELWCALRCIKCGGGSGQCCWGLLGDACLLTLTKGVCTTCMFLLVIFLVMRYQGFKAYAVLGGLTILLTCGTILFCWSSVTALGMRLLIRALDTEDDGVLREMEEHYGRCLTRDLEILGTCGKRAVLGIMSDKSAARQRALEHGLNGETPALTVPIVLTCPRHELDGLIAAYAHEHDGADLAHKLLDQGGHPYLAMAAHCMEPAMGRAYLVHATLDGWGTDERNLTRTLLCFHGHELSELVAAYKQAFGDIVKAIESETSGYYRTALVAVLDAASADRNRCDDSPADVAKALAGEFSAMLGADGTSLVDLLCRNSNATIQEARRLYEKQTGGDLHEDILAAETGSSLNPFNDNDFGELLGMLVLDGSQYGERFLSELKVCMEGFAADKFGLIALLSHVEDRDKLLAAYSKKFGSSLPEDILSATSTSAHFESSIWQAVLLGLCCTPESLWARTFYDACNGGWTGIGTDEDCLIDVLCLNRNRMPAVRREFEKLAGGSSMFDELDDEIEDDRFREILKFMLYPG